MNKTMQIFSSQTKNKHFLRQWSCCAALNKLCRYNDLITTCYNYVNMLPSAILSVCGSILTKVCSKVINFCIVVSVLSKFRSSSRMCGNSGHLFCSRLVVVEASFTVFDQKRQVGSVFSRLLEKVRRCRHVVFVFVFSPIRLLPNFIK